MNNIQPTEEHARKILEVLDFGLTLGKGTPEPGQMCVEAAVCYALGLPHGDEPPCVGSVIRWAKITLNDSEWSSNKARAEGLRRIAVAQLGSNGIDQIRFMNIVREQVVRRILPPILRKYDFEFEAERCEKDGNLDAVMSAELVMSRQSINSAIAAFNGSIGTRNCVVGAVSVAYHSIHDFGDTLLIETAKIIEEALVECKCEGVKFLKLLDVKE